MKVLEVCQNRMRAQAERGLEVRNEWNSLLNLSMSLMSLCFEVLTIILVLYITEFDCQF